MMKDRFLTNSVAVMLSCAGFAIPLPCQLKNSR
jgi:hypothetical protein